MLDTSSVDHNIFKAWPTDDKNDIQIAATVRNYQNNSPQ